MRRGEWVVFSIELQQLQAYCFELDFFSSKSGRPPFWFTQLKREKKLLVIYSPQGSMLFRHLWHCKLTGILTTTYPIWSSTEQSPWKLFIYLLVRNKGRLPNLMRLEEFFIFYFPYTPSCWTCSWERWNIFPISKSLGWWFQ